MDKVVPNNLIIILDAWFNVGLQGNKKKIWCSLFFYGGLVIMAL